MKKSVASFICAVILFSFVSCGKAQEDHAAESTSQAVSETEAETAELSTGLPAEDFGGEEIKFLIRAAEQGDPRWGSRELCVEDFNGEIINDTVMQRNRTVEDKYNIKITGQAERLGNLSAVITKSVKSGDNEFDCVMSSIGASSDFALAGLLYNLEEVDNFNFSQPWWNRILNGCLSFKNSLYYAVGNMNIMTFDGTAAMFFNKKLIKDYNLDDPYDLVRSDKWTIDKYTEMSVSFTSDLNGDGRFGKDDLWGSVSTQDAVWSLFNSCGGLFAYKNADDIPVFSEMDDKIMSRYEKINNCSAVGKTYNAQYKEFNNGEATTFDVNFTIFGDNRALFLTEVVDAALQLRSYEAEFGIIPYVKYDESQPDYISPVNTFASTAVAIPVTVPEPGRVAAILEDMSCISKNKLLPAYYDVTLTDKLTRDEESGEMLDVIFSHLILDIGWAYNFGDVKTQVFLVVLKGTGAFASTYEKITPKALSAVEKLIESYDLIG